MSNVKPLKGYTQVDSGTVKTAFNLPQTKHKFSLIMHYQFVYHRQGHFHALTVKGNSYNVQGMLDT
jgi:hypothetical protein